MPEDAVRRCRDAWREPAAESTSVIHGDPGAANIRIGLGGVGLIDWDEARIDASVLDLACLRDEVVERQLPPRRLGSVRRAANAWEAANGWLLELAYARRRLAEV
ncbi:MAG: phosphotransferase [Chloroflexota bacterium]|nr:phosphotransferase [Chloroflexota bacterium]